MFEIFEMFGQAFILRSFIAGVFIAMAAALIGTSVVLRRNAMIGDGLSHVGFGAFALATVLNVAPLEFALPIVILMSFLILRLNEQNKVQPDAVIAMVSAGALALGTFMISITKGVNTDINNYLFGSILSISESDLVLAVVFSMAVIILFLLCYNRIFALTFDEDFAKASGVNINLYNTLVTILISVTIVIGMKFMGSMLISCLIIFPAMTSMRIFKSYKAVVISSVIISTIALFIGITISYIYSTPTGASIVLVNLVLFVISCIVRRFISE